MRWYIEFMEFSETLKWEELYKGRLGELLFLRKWEPGWPRLCS